MAQAVEAIRHVGNFATHPIKDRQTGVVVDVEPGEAEWLLDVLELLFDFTFVQPSRFAQMRKSLNEKTSESGKTIIKGQ